MALSVSTPAKPVVQWPERAKAKPPTKINLSVDAGEKEGKSHFALTAPGPIAYHSLENGLHRVIDKFPDQEVYPFEYQFASTLSLPGTEQAGLGSACSRVWTELVFNLRASIERCKTVVIDNGTTAWDLLRLARLGKLTQVMPIQYTAVNQEFNDLVQLLHRSPANILWLHRIKAEYEGDKKTGKFERAGWGNIGFEVDAVIRLSYDETKGPVDGFRLRFGTCGPNRPLQGTELTGADINFDTVVRKIYPNFGQ